MFSIPELPFCKLIDRNYPILELMVKSVFGIPCDPLMLVVDGCKTVGCQSDTASQVAAVQVLSAKSVSAELSDVHRRSPCQGRLPSHETQR